MNFKSIMSRVLRTAHLKRRDLIANKIAASAEARELRAGIANCLSQLSSLTKSPILVKNYLIFRSKVHILQSLKVPNLLNNPHCEAQIVHDLEDNMIK